MNPIQRSYAELHLAVFLFGFTAILGDLIRLPALTLVWWRMAITMASLLLLVRLRRLFREIPPPTLWKFAGIGVLVAAHWLCFYGSVKLANPSITLVCVATTSLFTALTEPLLTRQPLKRYELALGLFIIPGMVLIANSAELGMMPGIWLGLGSALCAAVFATLNKILAGQMDELNVTFVELGSGGIVLTLLLPLFLTTDDMALSFWPRGTDWLYLLTLSLLCTTLAYVLALRSLRHLSAFASNLTVNLEPVYGIVLAWLLLDDARELRPGFYWGALVIMAAVFSYPLLRKRLGKNFPDRG